MLELQATDIDAVIHVIQESLTPIFLLTAIAGLLGVFTTRLARISDQVSSLSKSGATTIAHDITVRRRLSHLKRRSHALDLAVILGALAGACTCGTVLALFLGALRAKATGLILFTLFGSAICCTIGALTAFLAEMLLSSRGIRAEVDRHADEADVGIGASE